MLPKIPTFDIRHCYRLGYDCGKNGATTTNCHFAAFASPKKTAAWEEGKRDAEQNKTSKLDTESAE